MASFLFWNMNKQALGDDLTLLCDEFEIDVLALAECVVPVSDLLANLNSGILKGFSYVADPSPYPKLRWFTRLPASRIYRLIDGDGLSMLRVELLSSRKILLGAVHLPSKINEDEFEQLGTAEATSSVIRQIEIEQGIEDTIIFGDFNMNPFDKGMAAVTGFNAVMDRKIASRDKMSYKKKEYRCFYNPMWGRLGDSTIGPPGTHWFSRRLVRYHWNSYDQVIFRSPLLAAITDDNVVVIDQCDGKKFAGSGLHWKCGSDHLPVFVRIKE